MNQTSISSPLQRGFRATLLGGALLGVLLGAPALAQRRPVAGSTGGTAPLPAIQQRATALNPGLTTNVTRLSPSLQQQIPTARPAPRVTAAMPTTSELAARVGTNAFEWSRSLGYRSGLVHDMPGGTRVSGRPFGDHYFEPTTPGGSDLALVLYDRRTTLERPDDAGHAGFFFTIERPQPNHGYALTCTADARADGIEVGFIDYDDGIAQTTRGLREPRALTYVWENRGSGTQRHHIGFIVMAAPGQLTRDAPLGGLASLDGCVLHSYAL